MVRSVAVSGNILSYERVVDNKRLLILLNFSNSPVRTATEPGIVIVGTNSLRAP
jgi:hypothetical protein